MCDLSQGIEEKGIAIGRAEGTCACIKLHKKMRALKFTQLEGFCFIKGGQHNDFYMLP